MTLRRSLVIVLGCLVSLAAPVVPARAAPTTQRAPAPATKPSNQLLVPATKPAAPDLKRVEQLTRQSIKLMEEQKLAEAEPLLLQAIAIDPESVINLYNLACLKALRGRGDDAMGLLERAAEAGWTDFIHLSIDPDLNSLRSLPRYKLFVANKEVYQRRAAERVVLSLRRQFGDGYLYEIDEQDKLIFATNVDNATLADLKRGLQAQARSQWAQLFSHKPDEYISIVVPSIKDYAQLVKMPGVGGFYNDGAKLLIAKQLGQTMTHEFTHALHAADRAPLGQEHPIWLAEGIASMFEAASFRGDVLVPQDNFRLLSLQNAAKAKRLIPLERLFAMPQSQFVQRANMAYGQASSFMLFLYEQKLLKPFYDAYKINFDADPTGKAALEQVSGKPLADLERAWVDWMTRRPAPMLNTGADGAFLGTELGEANDGILIKGVLKGGPAEQAGIRPGDVLVGLDGVEIRDQLSFTPALAEHKPGSRIVLRVRRGSAYVDVPVTVGRRSTVLNAAAAPTPKPTTRPTTKPLATTRPAA